MAGRILGIEGKPYVAERTPRSLARERHLTASYDAAQTRDENVNHWRWADGLSADACNSPAIRKTLRDRTRYELRNNSYADGMVDTLALHAIGTGPRLQLRTASRTANRVIEQGFKKWAKAVQLSIKLRQMRRAKCVDGEDVGLLITNPGLRSPVKLDLRVIEADQLASPQLAFSTPNAVDGIRFDTWGNPVEYDILPHHPGGHFVWMLNEPKKWPRESVIHYFEATRPGQHRGVPELTPALPLFALLRRFTLATLGAAEFAASQSGVLKTASTALSDDEIEDVEAMESIEYHLRSLLTLPKGWDISQIKAEHPATTYQMFRNAILEEIARCLNMPFNIAVGNSSGYNYASGRLDKQTYYASIDVEREVIETLILDVLFDAWLNEALLIPGLIPVDAGPAANWTHEWYWDGHGHVDPVKEASAQIMRLAHGLTDYAAELAKEGRDYEECHEAQARALGLTIEQYRAMLASKLYGVPLAADAPDNNEDGATAEDKQANAIASIIVNAQRNGLDRETVAKLFAVALAS